MVLLHEFFFFLIFFHPTKTSLLCWIQSKGRSLPGILVSIWNFLHAPGKSKLVTADKGSFPLESSECSSKNPKFWWADLFLGIWPVCMSLWISLFLVFDFILQEVSLLSNQVQVLVGCMVVWLFISLIGLVCHQKQFLLCKPGSDFSTFLVWISLGISYRKASNLAGSWWC